MKYLLITGGYGGMGRAAARLFAQNGYTVFALDKRVDEPEENIIPIEADVTDEASLMRALEKVRGYSDSLSGIIHFAGLYMLDSLVEMGTEAFDKITDVNFRGVFLINKIFLPLLKRGSRILITTSELAPLDPLPFTGIYAVTKAALDKYAYSLAMELQLLGISVSVLRAGAVDTSMIGDSTSALDRFCESTKLYSCNADRFKRIVDGVEARRIPSKKLAQKAFKIFTSKRPRFAYSINRNPLLLLLNALPKSLQLWVIKLILK